MKASDLPKLAAPFASADVGWKPGAVTRDKTKGLAMAYINSRAIQDRLDAVCGPADWRNEFRPGPDGGVVCGLSVYVEREGAGPTGEWVTKWDGADNTDVEAVKGGLSGSMKRAAVMWGIGRSLYALPAQWVKLDERGRFAEPPKLPRDYTAGPGPKAAKMTPAAPESQPPGARPAPASQPALQASRQTGGDAISAEHAAALDAFSAQAQTTGLTGDGCTIALRAVGCLRLGDCTPEQLARVTEATATGEAVAELNAHGWTHRAARKIRAAAGARRTAELARAKEAASAHFRGALLARVLDSLDNALTLDLGDSPEDAAR